MIPTKEGFHVEDGAESDSIVSSFTLTHVICLRKSCDLGSVQLRKQQIVVESIESIGFSRFIDTVS